MCILVIYRLIVMWRAQNPLELGLCEDFGLNWQYVSRLLLLSNIESLRHSVLYQIGARS